MKRTWKALVVLLAVQAALSAAAATVEWAYACGACRAGGFSLGLVGLGFYAGLFIAALATGPSRVLFAAVLFGFGVHAMLVVQLIAGGRVCGLCLAAAAVSLAMAALAIAHDRQNLARIATMLPWSAILVIGWSAAPRAPALASASISDTAAVRVVVFTQPDCPYCDDLRDRVVPEAEREFGPRIQVSYRPAADLPAIRRTPTIVVTPGRKDRQTRVIEGLPSYDMLRGAILEMEGTP